MPMPVIDNLVKEERDSKVSSFYFYTLTDDLSFEKRIETFDRYHLYLEDAFSDAISNRFIYIVQWVGSTSPELYAKMKDRTDDEGYVLEDPFLTTDIFTKDFDKIFEVKKAQYLKSEDLIVYSYSNGIGTNFRESKSPRLVMGAASIREVVTDCNEKLSFDLTEDVLVSCDAQEHHQRFCASGETKERSASGYGWTLNLSDDNVFARNIDSAYSDPILLPDGKSFKIEIIKNKPHPSFGEGLRKGYSFYMVKTLVKEGGTDWYPLDNFSEVSGGLYVFSDSFETLDEAQAAGEKVLDDLASGFVAI